jgi:hypothetical protein
MEYDVLTPTHKIGPEETQQRSQMHQQDRKCKIMAIKQQCN